MLINIGLEVNLKIWLFRQHTVARLNELYPTHFRFPSVAFRYKFFMLDLLPYISNDTFFVLEKKKVSELQYFFVLTNASTMAEGSEKLDV